MQTVTIDILNNKAIKLLQDLEFLQLIRMHREKQSSPATVNWATSNRGEMTKQPLADMDNQLNELRNEWE